MIASPCNRICTLNEQRVCVGCGRSRDEIASWMQMSESDKKQALLKAKARLKALGDRRVLRR